jgi:hypothetical protein
MNQVIKMVMLLSAFAANLTLCSGAWADQTGLCSVGSAVAVDEDGTVGPPDLGDRERPTFFRVDAAKKELTLLAPASRRGEVTKFDTVHETDGGHLFSGVEHGRALSLIINAEGRMSLSVVGDGVVWSVFGHALREGEPDAPAQDESAADPEGEPSEALNDDSKDEPPTASKRESAAGTKEESTQEHVE